MLSFFRKYQRIFIFFITIVIVVTFTFFGTFKRMPRGGEVKNRVVTKAIDGSNIYLHDLKAISYILDVGYKNPVIKKYFLENGLADILFFTYENVLLEDHQARVERAKKYKHFSYQKMDAQKVWDIFCPEISHNLAQLKRQDKAGVETFKLFTSLYLNQEKFPPEALGKILFGKPSQLAASDMYNLALFGFVSTKDWFGPDFVDLMSQVILNIAKKAKQKGYTFKSEQIKQDFFKTFDQPMLSYFAGWSESSLLDTWEKVFLFKMYFQDVVDLTINDEKILEKLPSLYKQKAQIVHYKMPKAFQVKNLEELLKLSLYLRATTDFFQKESLFPLVLSASEVSKDYPELVEKTFQVKMKKLQKKELVLRISLKEMWQWQTEDVNWDLLCDQFYFLDRAITKEKRFEHLQTLNEEKRITVDHFSRRKIFSNTKVDMDQEFANLAFQEKTLALSTGFHKKILDGIENPQKFYVFLDTLEIGGQGIYSEDEQSYFLFHLEDKNEETILSLEHALKTGAMDALFQKFLEKKSLKIPLEKKDCVLAMKEEFPHFFSDLTEDMIEKSRTIQDYMNKKINAAFSEARRCLQKNPEDEKWFFSKGNDLHGQWKLIKEEKILEKNEDETFSQQVFNHHSDTWSDILTIDDTLQFFYVKERKEELDREQMNKAKQELSKEFLAHVFEVELKEILENNAAIIPLSVKE